MYTLHEIGYGSGEGFKGWNCRHDWHAYYKGISKPNYTLEQIKKLNEKNISYNGKKYTKYEISQMQRQGERNVRALKRRTLASQAAVENAKPPIAITHAPGHMFITDIINSELNDFLEAKKNR